MDRRTYLETVAAVVASTAAGCLGTESGGQEGGSPTEEEITETASPTRTTAHPSSPEPTPSSPARRAFPNYDWGKLQGVEPQVTGSIELRQTAFHPLVAEVPTATDIEFVNRDGYGHSVTIPAVDVDRRLAGGASTSVRFSTAGSYGYVCTLHPPDMLGRLVVSDDITVPPETPSPGTTVTTTTDGGGYY